MSAAPKPTNKPGRPAPAIGPPLVGAATAGLQGQTILAMPLASVYRPVTLLMPPQFRGQAPFFEWFGQILYTDQAVRQALSLRVQLIIRRPVSNVPASSLIWVSEVVVLCPDLKRKRP
jgi:hypothetical protein